MNHLLCLPAYCLLGILAAPALAQNSLTGPWAAVLTGPVPTAFYNTTRPQSPAPGVVWASSYGNSGMTSTSYFISASVDNGLTWQTNRSIDPYDLAPLDGQQAWLVATPYQLYHTTTGPGGFALAPSQVPGTPLFVRFCSPSVGVVVASPPTGAVAWPLYRTADGGQSWQLVANTPALTAGDSPTSCAQLGTQLWVTTRLGYVLHTLDAGLTWTTAHPPEALSKLAFRDAQHGLALGATATQPLYRTTDGGNTWGLLAATGPRRTKDLAAVPGSAGTYLSVGSSLLGLGGTNGTARSTDDGQTWQDLGGTEPLDYAAANATGQAWASVSATGTLRQFAGSVLATTPSAAPGAALAYPNPTTGRVQLPAAGPYQQAAVYDALGRHCCTARLQASESVLELGAFGAGSYHLRFDGGPAAPATQHLLVLP